MKNAWTLCLTKPSAPAPAEDVVRAVSPWRKAMVQVLWGLGLTAITFNFLGLNYILPSLGCALMLLGFRTLRGANCHFRLGLSCRRAALRHAGLSPRPRRHGHTLGGTERGADRPLGHCRLRRHAGLLAGSYRCEGRSGAGAARPGGGPAHALVRRHLRPGPRGHAPGRQCQSAGRSHGRRLHRHRRLALEALAAAGRGGLRHRGRARCA